MHKHRPYEDSVESPRGRRMNAAAGGDVINVRFIPGGAFMKLCRVFLVLSLALSVSASATTIPQDLETRAAELRRQASPKVLAWAHDQGVALARGSGPIDLAVLERTIRSQFGKKAAPAAPPAAGPGVASYPNLAGMGDGDIMALAFIVMMEAAKSAREDLKAIMDGVKSINKEKEAARKVANEINKSAASASPTPTPAPDRAAQLVAAARSIAGKTQGANLSAIARRLAAWDRE